MSTTPQTLKIISEKTNLTPSQVRSVFNALIEYIPEALKTEDKLRIVGLGSFYIANNSPRPCRNFKTGEIFKTLPSNSIKFKMAKSLKTSV